MPARKYIKPAQTSMKCLGLKQTEKLLIITDQNMLSIAWSLFDAALEIGANVQLIRIPVADSHGSEPPEPLPEFMLKFDAVIAPTTKSMSHTDARRAATKAGVRIATMPGILEETFIRAMAADYEIIAARGKALAKHMKLTKLIKVTSPSGTDIEFTKNDRKILVDTGLVHSPGNFCNLPAGEVFIAPNEGSGNGIIAVDGSMAGIGLVKSPLFITIEKGYAAKFKGYKAQELEQLLQPFGKDARNLAEFGIGTNDKARLCGSPLEDEKVIGTIHLALGDNQSMGGNVAVSSHLDGIIKRPSVWFDDRLVMRDGEFIV
ncbi:MAG: aminopeptidase [candidate division Zixibacteria bacterium]|nr:aminopeptidase [candidate division Zixibacteria bacterium]